MYKLNFGLVCKQFKYSKRWTRVQERYYLSMGYFVDRMAQAWVYADPLAEVVMMWLVVIRLWCLSKDSSSVLSADTVLAYLPVDGSCCWAQDADGVLSAERQSVLSRLLRRCCSYRLSAHNHVWPVYERLDCWCWSPRDMCHCIWCWGPGQQLQHLFHRPGASHISCFYLQVIYSTPFSFHYIKTSLNSKQT